MVHNVCQSQVAFQKLKLSAYTSSKVSDTKFHEVLRPIQFRQEK
jgi:hypothetical protein